MQAGMEGFELHWENLAILDILDLSIYMDR